MVLFEENTIAMIEIKIQTQLEIHAIVASWSLQGAKPQAIDQNSDDNIDNIEHIKPQVNSGTLFITTSLVNLLLNNSHYKMLI